MSKDITYWVRHTHLFYKDEYECSACGIKADKEYKTCPYCGKQMKGSKYDPSWFDELELVDSVLDD